ncbi:MAG: OstA-like protein [Bacteroidales bacterium]|nr:OstA-like protein [Bacteroidales bacterium]
MLPLLLHAQDQKGQQKPRLIHLLKANSLSFNKKHDAERQVLRGDVLFRQDSVYMQCDSAYFYQSTNSFEAFSNVHMYEGDTLHMWCDSLSYDGNTQFGELFDNVILRHNDVELHTDYLQYRRPEAEAHYPYSGNIQDPQNHLFSSLGWYYPNDRHATFRNNVVMKSYDFSAMPDSVRPLYPDPDERVLYRPKATLYSDSLDYNFISKDAHVTGPSRIVGDTATLYTTEGTMNTGTQKSWLYKRSRAVSPGRYATADTLFYDGILGVGEGFGRFVAHDSIQHVRVQGDYGHYTRDPQVVTVTRRALAMEFSGKDTLYMHADTLRSYTILKEKTMQVAEDSVQICDTLKVTREIALEDSVITETIDSLACRMEARFHDSIYTDTIHYMACFHNVRYFRTDLQGVCDSLNYNSSDSLATFVGNPVMWNSNYQITGDTIFAWMGENKGISRCLIHDQAQLAQQHDSIHYDQIAGKELMCYFDDAGKIRQMDVSGNVQTIFFPVEGKGEERYLLGLNQVIGNFLTVWFKDQKMDHLRIWPSPVGSMTPLFLVTPEILYLNGFRWMDYLRPVSAEDVFRDIRMKDEDKVESVRLFDDDELNGY